MHSGAPRGARRGDPRPAERLVEAYWSGLATWVLGRTEPGWWPSRHRILLDRLRQATLDVGEALIERRHGQPTRLAVAADRLLWFVDLCEAQSALRPAEIARIRTGLSAVRGLADPPSAPYNDRRAEVTR